jgi:ABC transporter substrate binding protein
LTQSGHLIKPFLRGISSSSVPAYGDTIPLEVPGVPMRRRDFIKVIGGGAIAWPVAGRAQQPERMHRIGVLMGYPEGDKQAQAGADALRKGLQNLGWVEGRNIQLDYRWPGPDAEKARTFAKELISLSPDVIVSSTNQVTGILQQETRTIPIVFAFVGDPVGSALSKVCRDQVETLPGSPISRIRSEVSGN